MDDVSTYLSGKGVTVFRANGMEVTCHCIFCPDGDPKGKGKLYVNTESWLYDCKRCMTTGNRRTLLKHFGDQDDSPAYLPGADPMARRKVLEDATELAHEMLLGNERIMAYLSKRGIKAQTILDYKIGYVPKGWSLIGSLGGHAAIDLTAAGVRTEAGRDFFFDKITIPYLQRGSVVQLRGKDPAGKYYTPSGDSVRLFNADVMAGADDVIITEGEFDCFLNDTEVLTPNGWTRFDAYMPGTSVVQYDEDGGLEMVAPLAYTTKETDNLLRVFTEKRGGIDLVVTPGHRMVSTLADGTGLRIHRADERPSARHHVPRVGVLDGPGIPYSDDEIALLLAMAADATLDRRVTDGAQYARLGISKYRKVERLTDILKRLDIEASVSLVKAGYTSVCFRVPNYLDGFKRLPVSWLIEASSAQREFILAEMVEWDGNHVVSRSQHEFSSRDLDDATWMQTMAHTAGRVSTIMRRENEHGIWYKASILHEKRSSSWQAIRTEPYGAGTVHCVQVPSGMLLVRRHNEITVSGNCLILQQTLSLSKDPKVRATAVVGIPGAGSLPAGFEGYFTEAKRVYIALDPDDVGRKAAIKIKEMLGSKARIVELPTDLPKCDWCADEETEALTRRGWLRYDEVQVGDEVWSIDPGSGVASWAPVASVFREHRDRTMIHMQAATHDSLTTPGHRWLTQRGFVLTKDLRPKDRLPLTAPAALPEQGKYDDDLVELVAWYYTEGHSRSAGVSIAQAEPKAGRLRALLARMFGAAYDGPYMDRLTPCWRERQRPWGVIEFDLNARASAALREVCPDKTPSMDLLASLTRSQLDLFVNVSVDCDGWRRGAQRYFVQADEGRRDAFVTACALRGYATRVSTRMPQGHGSRQQWVVNVLQRSEARVASLQRTEVTYSGIIWCPSVPGRSTWFARRNGKSYFTGNTEYLTTRDKSLSDVMELLGTASGKRLWSVHEAGAKYRKRRSEASGIATGFVELDAWFRPGMEPGDLIIPLAKTGVGKSQANTSLLRTPDGIRLWGDLRPGDSVWGSNGKPTKITHVFPRGDLETFRVIFSDYSTAEVGEDHIWHVGQRGGRTRDWQWSNMTTKEIQQAGLRCGHQAREYRFRIPLVQPIAGRHQKLPIQPYTMGALISNGSCTHITPTLTTPDHDVITHVRAEGYTANSYAAPVGACPRWGILGLGVHLRGLNLDVTSGQKFIPEVYLEADLAQRTALLQGLMDGDGGGRDTSRRSVCYWTTSKQLSEDVRTLVQSLGGTATIIEVNRARENKPTEYKMSIMLPEQVSPFSTPRKQRGAGVNYTQPRRVITSIESTGRLEPHTCIKVAAADSLHCGGLEYVVTHNTNFLVSIAYYTRLRPTLMVTLEMTSSQVYERLRRVYHFWHPLAEDWEMEEAFSNLRIVDENRLREGDIATLADEYHAELGFRPQLGMVDYLGYYAKGCKGNGAYEKTTNAVMALKAEAKDSEMAIITPHQVNRMAQDGKPIEASDARDSGAVEETADLLVSLYRPDEAIEGSREAVPSGVVRLGVLKNRKGGKDMATNLMFSSASLALMDHGTPAAMVAAEENRILWRGEEYAAVRKYRKQVALQRAQLKLVGT